MVLGALLLAVPLLGVTLPLGSFFIFLDFLPYFIWIKCLPKPASVCNEVLDSRVCAVVLINEVL